MNRLPPEYRRRLYINCSIVAAFVGFFAIVGRLGERDATTAIVWFLALLLLFTAVWPLIQLLRCHPRPKRASFILYAAWICAYAYVAVATVLRLPGIAAALLVGGVLMIAFFVLYRKLIFPDFFKGEFRARWRTIRQAQRDAKAERESLVKRSRM